MNGSDCGMFTCKYADYITKDKPITFTQVTSNSISESIFSVSSHNEGLKMSLLFCFWQKHMPYFRKRIVWEIVNHKLLWCEDDNCEVVQLPHILMMVEFYSPGKDSQMGDLNSGNNFHTSSSDQEPAQRFPSSAKSSWKDVAGATNHCLQLLLQFFFVCVSDSSSNALICTVQSELFLKLHLCKSYSEVECSLHVFVPQSVVIEHSLINMYCVISKSKKKKSVLKADYIPKCQSLYFPPDLHTWELHTMVAQSGGTHEITHIVLILKVLSLFQAGLPG